MASLAEDLENSAVWISEALSSSGYLADFSPASLWAIDRFFEDHAVAGRPRPGGLLEKDLGGCLFALGAYVGEVIRRALGARWRTGGHDRHGEVDVELVLPDGSIIWPVQRVMKRFHNGAEDGLFAYGVGLGVAGSARMADLRRPYRAVLPGFSDRLPFEVFTEQLGPPRFGFGIDERFGSLESFGIVDTMFFSCEVFTTSIEPERGIWDLVGVTIETYATNEQARAVFDAEQPDADAEPVQFGELTGTVDRWRAFQYPLPLAQHGQYTRKLEMVDRNVVASVSFDFIPGRIDERRFASATVDFVTAMWIDLRSNTRTTPTTSIAAPPTSAYPLRLNHGFSPRWDITALEAVLGPRLAIAYPDFRSLDASMVGCQLRTAGPHDGDSRRPGATITLHVKYFDSADKATAFFAVHFTVAAGPLPPLGALADITAMSWQYRPPSDDHDGMYIVAIADNNTVVLLQVASSVGNTVIDDQLAGPVADILNTALTLIRGRGGRQVVERVSGLATAEEPRPFVGPEEVWSEDALDGVDWRRVSHAFGSALDTPGYLRGLTAADVVTRRSALSHLWNSVTHQESLTMATAAVAELLARMLTDHRLAEPAPAEERSMRASLLSYLGHVAAWAAYLQAKPNIVGYVRRDDPEVGVFDVVWEPENDPDYVVMERLGSGCARRAGVVIPLLMPWLDAPDPQERATALYAVACWVGLAGATVAVPSRALERLTAVATDGTAELDCRIDCVLSLAANGADTSDLLDDASMVIRACAALSPAPADDPRALPVLIAALTSPGSGDDWLRRRPPVPYVEATFSARLVEATLRCTDDFELLLPAAVAVAAAARPWTIGETWGPLLAAAFPAAPAADRSLSTAQRAYLFVLAANDTIWKDPQENRDELLRGLGLPLHRDAVRSLATTP